MAALAGKVAIITGGSKGIGKATALRLARDGAKVALQYLSDDQSAQEVVNAIGEENALAIKGNAGSVADSDELIRRTVDKFGQVDILIANAGSLPVRDLASTSEQDFNDCMDLNVKGPYFLVQVQAPQHEDWVTALAAEYLEKETLLMVDDYRKWSLTSAPGARIILVSTTLCHASTIAPSYLLYLTTKGAVEQMVRVLAKDLGPKEITINAVAPGPTDTVLFTRGKPEAMLNAIKNLSPRGRFGKPEEIAEAMAFFSSPASGWVSGQILRVNGGMA